MRLPILKVSQLNRYVKSQLEADPRLKEIYVAGEIGTLTANQRSGHLYFTLRDDTSSIKAVMFAGNALQLKFMPQSGLAVVARGAATLYERDGTFQLMVSELMLDGAGAQGFAFEKQKQLLAAKGYFDEHKKRAIPPNPTIVGVVTSDSGAALHDIFSVIARKNPTVQLLLAPAVVQGPEAPASIAAAIAAINRDGRSEVLIVGRGGGSAEDLWAFNEESVVRAVAQSRIPTISAVGHETDITLCDLAADLRAATPTAAAELAVTDRAQLLERLGQRKNMLKNAMTHQLILKERLLLEKKSTEPLKNPWFFINKNRQRLNNLIESMYNLSQSEISNRLKPVSQRAALLDSLSPLRILARGYCIATKEGHPVISAGHLQEEDNITLRLHEGSATAVIQSIATEGEET
ncbi:exodeoxyribonuclease VII large subunit [Oscillospiraceae bacterium LTW-04]|nr:exodeoxyribonuclease VII large subunit [Oscillospiraceae bacterium MB24-C1]